LKKQCFLTGPVDLQTVLGTTDIVGFYRAPVVIASKLSSITPQPLSFLMREENEYKSALLSDLRS